MSDMMNAPGGKGNQIMAIAPVEASTAKASTRSGASLAANFDNFLKLLTTQLQRQDPLAPMDATTFTSQLVEFASVEQVIQTNSRLEEMLDLFQAASATASLDLLGKEVTAPSDQINLPPEGGSTIRYRLDSMAANATVTVTDSRGRVVHRAPAPTAAGVNTLAWDGRTLDGSMAAPGTYKISVSAKSPEGSTIKATPLLQGRVQGVEPNGGDTQLLVGGLNVPLKKVERIM